MPSWKEILALLGGAAAVSGALTWLSKHLVETFLKHRTEAYREELRLNSEQTLAILKDQLSLQSTAWLETWKKGLELETTARVEAYKIALNTESSKILAAYNSQLSLAATLKADRERSRLAEEQALALKVAEHRDQPYRQLWALQEMLSPTSEQELTAEVRTELNDAFISWYYRDGNGIFLSLAAGDQFLIAKQLLTRDRQEVTDEQLRAAFSDLRTQLKSDLKVYDEISAATQIGV